MNIRDGTKRRASSRRVWVLALAFYLAGCASGPFSTQASDQFLASSAGQSNNHEARALTDYLLIMRSLLAGDPVTQAEVFRETSQAADAWPTATNRLRLALAMATPGHPWANAAEAQERLSGLLAANDSLLPEERVLATIYLKQVEEQLVLDAETRRLQNEAEQALSRQNTDNARLLEAALEENRRLRAELADAREKLEAITNIERSIRERESATDSP